MKKHLVMVFILLVLTGFLLFLQFRFPLVLNMDGGYNAANVKALMSFKSMPYDGSPPVPFALSAIFGLMFSSASIGIKIVVTMSLVAVGLLIYLFVRKITGDDIAAIAALAGWCVSTAIVTYPMGYLKQTVALPFLVGGLMSLYLLFTEKKKLLWGLFFALSFPLVYLSHSPSFLALLASSYVIAAIMLAFSETKTQKIFGFSMLILFILGLASTPWTLPILAKKMIQIDPKGYSTIAIYLKGLFAFRFEQSVDFRGFDWLLATVPVFGLAFCARAGWKKFTLWSLGFLAGIFVLSCFLAKYEWQGRNVMTMLVPLSMMMGLGFYEASGLLFKEKLQKTIAAVLVALCVFLMAGYQSTAIKYAKTGKPIITEEQLSDLSAFISPFDQSIKENLYARHGLRFWATYATGDPVGVFFYDWDRKTFAIRKSRGEEDVGESRKPDREDYLFVSKRPLFGCRIEKLSAPNFKAYVPEQAQEYIKVTVRTTSPIRSLRVTFRDEMWRLVYQQDMKNVLPGEYLDFGKLLNGIKRGTYYLQVTGDSHSTVPFMVKVTENLLSYSEKPFGAVSESKDFVLVRIK